MAPEDHIEFQKVVIAAHELNTNRAAQPDQVKLLCDFIFECEKMMSHVKYDPKQVIALAERGLLRTVAHVPAPSPPMAPDTKLAILEALDDFEASRAVHWARLRTSLKR